MDDAARAATLYPSSAPSPEPFPALAINGDPQPEAPEPAGATSPDATKLYPDSPEAEPSLPPKVQGDKRLSAPPPPLDVEKHLPDDIKNLRSEDAERRLYSPQQTYSNVIPDDMFEQHGTVPVEISPEVQTAIIREYRELAADTGLSHDDVQLLKDRTMALHASPVSQEQQQAEARQRLAAEFGPEGVANALKAANALLNRDPRVRALLQGWGLGDDPDTVVLVARAAVRERTKGRLK